MALPKITKDILVEELVENYSFSVRYLMERGIRCIMCGEPIWGTLEEAAREKGFTDDQIDHVVSELNKLSQIEKKDGTDMVIMEFTKLHH